MFVVARSIYQMVWQTNVDLWVMFGKLRSVRSWEGRVKQSKIRDDFRAAKSHVQGGIEIAGIQSKSV